VAKAKTSKIVKAKEQGFKGKGLLLIRGV